MTHRIGHIENAGDGTLSMDRRKYLSTLAAGVAFGTVAAACGSPSGSDKQRLVDSTATPVAPPATCTTLKQWGYLSLFPPGILTVAEAQGNMPAPGSKMIRLPFFNSNGIPITEGMVVGLHLVRIGCPSIFAVAINLVDHDHHTIEESEREIHVRRNTNMDTILRNMGYVEVNWSAPDGKECAPYPEDWSQ